MAESDDDIPELLSDRKSPDEAAERLRLMPLSRRFALSPSKPTSHSSSLPPAAVDPQDFELDYGNDERDASHETESLGSVDEMEFDPLSAREAPLQEWKSIPPPRASEPPGHRTGSRREAGLEIDLPESNPSSPKSAEPMSSRWPAAGPSSGGIPEGSLPDAKIPDLYVPAPAPSQRRPAPSPASPSGTQPPPARSAYPPPDLSTGPFHPSYPPSGTQPPSARSAYPPSGTQPPSARSSRPPPDLSTGSVHPSYPPPASSPSSVSGLRPGAGPSSEAPASAFGGGPPSVEGPESYGSPGGDSSAHYFGDGLDLGGGFDDFDLAGVSRASALDVAVALPQAKQDGVAWPTGRTPRAEEFDWAQDELHKLSGFGPAPSSIFGAPVYALRVRSAMKPLQQRLRAAERRLMDLEDARDEMLAQLAEALREQLQGKDRFAPLYASLGRHDENIVQRSQSLQAADTEGALELKKLDAQLETLRGTRAQREQQRDAQSKTRAEHELALGRLQAQLRRLAIEERNLHQRFEREELSEARYYAQLAQLKEKAEQRGQALSELTQERGRYAHLVDQAEDALRVAVAEMQTLEAKKEGLLNAFEGAVAVHGRALQDAKRARRHDLAEAARAILDLRGEVPIDAETRKRILAADQAAAGAVREREGLQRALASLDSRKYAAGKAAWVAVIFGAIGLSLLARLL